MGNQEWGRLTREVGSLVEEVDGDDREYGDDTWRLQKKVLSSRLQKLESAEMSAHVTNLHI
jgi:hypothetical protein